MNRTHATVAGLGLVALLGAGTLAACTSDEEPGGTASTSGTGTSATSPSASPSVEGTDQSAAVLSAQLPAVKGSSAGTLDQQPATLNVADVRATAGATMLTFWYTGAAKELTNYGEYSWQRLPVIVDVAGKKIYEPLTFTNERGEALCLCTDTASVRGEPQPRTALYPALPAGATTLEVRQKGFAKPIPVPLSR